MYIQDWWRNLQGRKAQREVHHQQIQELQKSKSKPRQEPVKQPPAPKRPPRILNAQEAATMIQRAWRRHIVSQNSFSS